MPNASEKPKTPIAIRVVEMVGESKDNWTEAAKLLVERAAKSYPHITGLDVQHSTAVVREGKIVEYHIDVKLAYIADPAPAPG